MFINLLTDLNILSHRNLRWSINLRRVLKLRCNYGTYISLSYFDVNILPHSTLLRTLTYVRYQTDLVS